MQEAIHMLNAKVIKPRAFMEGMGYSTAQVAVPCEASCGRRQLLSNASALQADVTQRLVLTGETVSK
jgi:hypothetical protein